MRRFCIVLLCENDTLAASSAEETMKILYGVVGEGMGHAMRSRVILQNENGDEATWTLDAEGFWTLRKKDRS